MDSPHDEESQDVVKEEVDINEIIVHVPSATKDGEIVRFTILVKQNGKPDLNIVRQFEDFEWLNHCLRTEMKELGIIYPPLPPAPIVDPKLASKMTKQQYGDDCSILMADGFNADCQRLEKYLKLLLGHRRLRTASSLRDFLLQSEAAVRARIKPGMMAKISASISEYRKTSEKDLDFFFEKERVRIAEYSQTLKAAAMAFHRMIFGQLRLSTSENYLSSSLTQGNIYAKDETSKKLEKLLHRCADVYKDENHVDEVSAQNSISSLGRNLDLLSRYLDSVKDALYRRTCLMVEYDNATKALSSAKPQKQAALQQAKDEKEKLYEECTEVLKKELEAFDNIRREELSRSLTRFTELQITTAVDRHALLVKHLNSIKNLF